MKPRCLGVLAVLVLMSGLLSGCAAVTNPVANGIPVRRMAPELLAESKEDYLPIPLTMLRQIPPVDYRVGPGDVLGVWIETILGLKEQLPPVQAAPAGNLPPAIGVPIVVRENGTINLPLIPPEKVEGMTVTEVEQVIREAYTVKRKILQPGKEAIIVTLLRPRQYHVLVIREDAGSISVSLGNNTGFGGGGGATGSYRGIGFTLDLPAGENDVLNALARTGGLPGVEGKDEVIIQRGKFKSEADRENFLKELSLQPNPQAARELAARGGVEIIRIPLRIKPGEIPKFKPDDVVLQSGDIVFIAARELDVFYTGGLLPAGEYVLPRNYDIDVVECISRISGPLVSGGISGNNFLSANTNVGSGLGNPSPSLLTVLRRTPGGGQVAIRVDLNRALQDPRENILVKPGDKLILQETMGEAIARYATNILGFNMTAILWTRRDAAGSGSLNLP